ncbi:Hypothetical predicted protein [Olea europaea subsp. europaea]|uniref:Uncharacterized protein n=1 Tax=Olea europaea subsp. europaea TaxID=158383 RepID=A0A8S0TS16_OLEEU|nr:Hypothetical predicted protein [Olea europaea subsp. europaea]
MEEILSGNFSSRFLESASAQMERLEPVCLPDCLALGPPLCCRAAPNTGEAVPLSQWRPNGPILLLSRRRSTLGRSGTTRAQAGGDSRSAAVQRRQLGNLVAAAISRRTNLGPATTNNELGRGTRTSLFCIHKTRKNLRSGPASFVRASWPLVFILHRSFIDRFRILAQLAGPFDLHQTHTHFFYGPSAATEQRRANTIDQLQNSRRELLHQPREQTRGSRPKVGSPRVRGVMGFSLPSCVDIYGAVAQRPLSSSKQKQTRLQPVCVSDLQLRKRRSRVLALAVRGPELLIQFAILFHRIDSSQSSISNMSCPNSCQLNWKNYKNN